MSTHFLALSVLNDTPEVNNETVTLKLRVVEARAPPPTFLNHTVQNTRNQIEVSGHTNILAQSQDSSYFLRMLQTVAFPTGEVSYFPRPRWGFKYQEIILQLEEEPFCWNSTPTFSWIISPQFKYNHVLWKSKCDLPACVHVHSWARAHIRF